MKKILMFVLAIMLLASCQEEASYITISLDEVESKVEEGFIILDVREVFEYDEGHIPNSVNKPLSELQEGDFSNISKNEKYIVICRSGNRSITASDILTESGFTVVNTSEGVSTWPGELVR
ncbi:MAG: rhodanese-like domain-containing protein [Lysinibacillus sp.]|nr:rhodanese-like domain-containing protein [Lysinibacillus sp.]